MTAGIVDDRAFLSCREVVVIFFQCSVFFLCPPLSTLFVFTEFVYGIVPTIFSVFVYRVPVAPLLPSFASVGAPARARSTLEFQPASSTQSRASVPRAYRAKRVAENES